MQSLLEDLCQILRELKEHREGLVGHPGHSLDQAVLYDYLHRRQLDKAGKVAALQGRYKKSKELLKLLGLPFSPSGDTELKY